MSYLTPLEKAVQQDRRTPPGQTTFGKSFKLIKTINCHVWWLFHVLLLGRKQHICISNHWLEKDCNALMKTRLLQPVIWYS